jgi:hypothetical protein
MANIEPHDNLYWPKESGGEGEAAIEMLQHLDQMLDFDSPIDAQWSNELTAPNLVEINKTFVRISDFLREL